MARLELPKFKATLSILSHLQGPMTETGAQNKRYTVGSVTFLQRRYQKKDVGLPPASVCFIPRYYRDMLAVVSL